ncbi:hypothetical protein PHK61_27785 [Actinomycetospora lutea]|uniref:hypothetical protein n=1 Tax=Actinomycetospora lutea TaxID=663604 RepID=UPI002365F3E5|nr:hypothetical protein [Actinomycetospora lutea]MDD7942221.1 hypothetical protein [Actinomycetospora lutea]
MRDRMDDRLIQEPRIRRIVRPRPSAPPTDGRGDERGVPTPRVPARDERRED